MSEHTPDTWVIIKLVQDDGKVLHRVLGGWSESYLYGSSWRINSGITRVEQDVDMYHIHVRSGFVYHFQNNMQRLTMARAPTFAAIVDKLGEDRAMIVDVSTLLEDV